MLFFFWRLNFRFTDIPIIINSLVPCFHCFHSSCYLLHNLLTSTFVISLPPRQPPRPLLDLKAILNPLLLSLRLYSMLFSCTYTTNGGSLGASVRDKLSIRETISSISQFNCPSSFPSTSLDIHLLNIKKKYKRISKQDLLVSFHQIWNCQRMETFGLQIVL